MEEFKKVKVLVSLCLSKEVEVEVSDYTSTTELDEDGFPHESCDFSNTDLTGAVVEQIKLPGKGWNVDEFIVELNE